MTKAEMEQEIEALKQRVAALEARGRRDDPMRNPVRPYRQPPFYRRELVAYQDDAGFIRYPATTASNTS